VMRHYEKSHLRKRGYGKLAVDRSGVFIPLFKI
jgi:hypothetical protein